MHDCGHHAHVACGSVSNVDDLNDTSFRTRNMLVTDILQDDYCSSSGQRAELELVQVHNGVMEQAYQIKVFWCLSLKNGCKIQRTWETWIAQATGQLRGESQTIERQSQCSKDRWNCECRVESRRPSTTQQRLKNRPHVSLTLL